MTIEELYSKIQKLHAEGAYHIKRGFSLKDAEPVRTANHLIEEVVELQAEIIEGEYDLSLEEASDVLLVYLHLIHLLGIDFGVYLSHIIDCANKKLDKNWTLDKSKILTNTPGFTRRNRDENLSNTI